MKKEDAEEYTQALEKIWSGSWEQIAWAHKQGIPESLGFQSTEQWVKERLGGHIRLSIAERREAVQELTDEGLSSRAVGQVLGINQATVIRDRAADANASLDKKESAINTVLEIGTDANASLKHQATEETRTRREVSRSAESLESAMDYRVGDARVVMEEIPDCSINLVLTDPPYGDAAEPLYRWLAQWSARVLIPGGSLICYTGQSRLNRDMRIFDEHLRYWWLMSMNHKQPQRLPGKFVMAGFKPVLWYVKEYRRGRTLVSDILLSPKDKSEHAWGQGSAGVELLIENLTDPGEWIADPFAGTGIWGEITAQMGRRWFGCDIVRGGKAEVTV